MATTTVARSAQALRNRRDGVRASVSKRAASTLDAGSESLLAPHKKRKLSEPYVRDSAYILRKHKGKPASLVIHLHPNHFRFDGQDGSFAYDSPMRFVIEHLRKQTVPHDMLEELWAEHVPFYDGCLIVEVHNHRTATNAEKSKRNDVANRTDTVKFSMHNYNDHVTPSPLVPYPKKPKNEAEAEKSADSQGEDSTAQEQAAKADQKSGPKVTTMVLHPTALSRHHEILLLANTPATEMRAKKKGSDAQPSTPSLSVPPTPLSAGGPRANSLQPQKMCLEEPDFYGFQSDLLVTTEPPLYLEPANSADEAERILEMLIHPLHNEEPPSPKTRKRTTAEMAADDAQAAEAERRMLIMDERIKPSGRAGAGSAANENQAAAASLGFSRFKTLEMVRQKHEEQERVKKEEEARAALEKRQNEEHAQQQKQILQATRQRELMQQQQQRHNMMMAQQTAQRPEQIRQQMEAQRQQMAAREHALPQQNGMVAGQVPQASVAQSSPVVRQQTPLVASSPMLATGGFPMAQTSSQGGASPARPTSAALQNRNAAMARQASQQQQGSQANTPQMAQGTPNMSQAMPNRQMAQTPRLPTGSPANRMQGTPNGMNMNMNMGQQSQLTPEQMAMLQAQQQRNQQGMNGSSPPQNLTPEQIQNFRAQQFAKQQAYMHYQQAQANGANPNVAANQAYRATMMRQIQQQQHMKQMQTQMLQQQQGGQAGSPQQMGHGNGQPTPQMNHTHPQTPIQQQGTPTGMPGQAEQMTPQQQQHLAQVKAQQLQMQRQSQQQLHLLMNQYGGLMNIPPSVVNSLNPQMQAMLRIQADKQRLHRQQQQQQASRAQQMQQNGGDQVPASQPNPQYMQALRANQAILMNSMQQQQGQANNNGGAAGINNMNGMNGMNAMAMNMNMGNQGNFTGMPQGGDLSQHFRAATRALGQPNNQHMGGGGAQ